MKGKQNKGNEEQKTATKGLIRFDTLYNIECAINRTMIRIKEDNFN